MEDPSVLFAGWFKSLQAASSTKQADAFETGTITTSLKILVPVRPRINIHMHSR
jgi:hypothetical protein